MIKSCDDDPLRFLPLGRGDGGGGVGGGGGGGAGSVDIT
jgi:hypothetical protein